MSKVGRGALHLLKFDRLFSIFIDNVAVESNSLIEANSNVWPGGPCETFAGGLKIQISGVFTLRIEGVDY